MISVYLLLDWQYVNTDTLTGFLVFFLWRKRADRDIPGLPREEGTGNFPLTTIVADSPVRESV